VLNSRIMSRNFDLESVSKRNEPNAASADSDFPVGNQTTTAGYAITSISVKKFKLVSLTPGIDGGRSLPRTHPPSSPNESSEYLIGQRLRERRFSV